MARSKGWSASPSSGCSTRGKNRKALSRAHSSLTPSLPRSTRASTRPAAVFSAADYTGAAGAAFDASGDEIVRRPVRPERSFAQSIIGSGPAAFFAPLHKTDARLAEFEWTEAILRDQPLGLAVKREYDLSVLLSGYSNPAIGRFVDGRTAPTGSENPAFLALTRVMYGDPLLQPFSRRTAGPLLEEERLDTIDTQGNRVRRRK